MERNILFEKKDIVKAAFILLKQQTVDEFTIRNIANILNSSTSPIYYHFKSLEELMDAMIEEVMDLFLAPVKDKEDYYSYPNLTLAYALFSKNHRKLFESIFLYSSPKLGNPFREKMYREFRQLLTKDKKFDMVNGYVDLLFGDGLALKVYNSINKDTMEGEILDLLEKYITLRRKLEEVIS